MSNPDTCTCKSSTRQFDHPPTSPKELHHSEKITAAFVATDVDVVAHNSKSLSIPLSPSLPHPQSRMASCGSCFWCIIWLLVLLCVGWPLSITLGGLYGLISPLTTCLGLDRLSDLLLEGANIGRTCAHNMRHCKPLC